MRLSGRVVTEPGRPATPGTLTVRGSRIESVSFDQNAVAEHYIVPGFIDSHTHPLEAGLESLCVNVAGATRLEAVLEKLRARARDGKDWGVLLAFNLEPDILSEARYPSRAELDGVTGGVPTLVYRIDGHSAATNSAGLDLVTGRATDGIELDAAGKPTGVMRGPAYEAASRLFKRRLRPELVQAALRLAGDHAAAAGITTLGAFVGDDELLAEHWRSLLDGLSRMSSGAVPYLQTWRIATARHHGLRQVGGCLLIDGSFGSRTAALRDGYADSPGDSGRTYVDDDRLTAFYREAEAAGLQTAVHAIGDRAVEQVVCCLERAGVNGRPNRHRIEHAELLSDDLVRRIAAVGMVLGVQPAFEAAWGGPDRMYARRLGDRWRRTNPFRSLLAAGVVLGGGSDAPITPMNPLAGMAAAVHHSNPDQGLSPDEAFALFTTGAAVALRVDDRVGRLAAGMQADFVILSSDPRDGADCRVIATYRNGQRTYENPAFAGDLLLPSASI